MKDIIIVGDTPVELTIERKHITKYMYSRSKYGGVNLGLVQENLTPEWSCQACGEKQIAELPPFMFEFLPREFIRICSVCHNRRLRLNITALEDLISLVRPSHL